MSFVKKYSKYKGVARFTLLLVGLLFILMLARESWGEISNLIEHVKVGQFVLSVILAVFGNMILAILFNRLLGKYGVNIPDVLAMKMYMIGQVAKYIPGKIWAVAYQISHVPGVVGAKGIVLANLEMMLGIMLMTSVIAIALLAFQASTLLACIVTILGMIVFVFLYKTNLVSYVLKLVPKKFRNNDFLVRTEHESMSYFLGIIFYIVFLLIYICSYLLMLDSVFGFSFDESIIYIALLSVAWIGGVFAIIVPAGMGVREVLFVVISSIVIPQYSVEALVTIAVLARFWQIIQELVGVLLLVILPRR